MRDTVVFRRVQHSVLIDYLVAHIRQQVEFGPGSLAHRPGVSLIVYANCYQIPACLLNLVIVLSQTGELRRAGRSPVAAIEDQNQRAVRQRLRQRYQLAVAVGQRKRGRFVADLEIGSCPLRKGRRCRQKQKNGRYKCFLHRGFNLSAVFAIVNDPRRLNVR